MGRARMVALCDLMVVGLRVGGSEENMEVGIRWLTGFKIINYEDILERAERATVEVEVRER